MFHIGFVQAQPGLGHRPHVCLHSSSSPCPCSALGGCCGERGLTWAPCWPTANQGVSADEVQPGGTPHHEPHHKCRSRLQLSVLTSGCVRRQIAQCETSNPRLGLGLQWILPEVPYGKSKACAVWLPFTSPACVGWLQWILQETVCCCCRSCVKTKTLALNPYGQRCR